MTDTRIVGLISSLTPARIAVSRAGTRPKTCDWLKFRCDHASARDAVHSELSAKFLEPFVANGTPVIQSLATDRRDYILFPPKGKRTSDEVIAGLQQNCLKAHDVQIVVSDGLSARAAEENAHDMLAILRDGLELEGISSGTLVIAKLARVAIGDQIAHALGAKIVVNLIGERPGLTSAASMSAYITYNPGPQTISSDRTVVSNIHKGGTPCVEAGAYVTKLIKTMLEVKVSGVRLQQLS